MQHVEIRTINQDYNSSSHFRIIRDSVVFYPKRLKFGLSSIFSFAIDFGILFPHRSLTSGLGNALLLFVSATRASAASSTCNLQWASELRLKAKIRQVWRHLNIFSWQGRCFLSTSSWSTCLTSCRGGHYGVESLLWKHYSLLPVMSYRRKCIYGGK